MSITSESGRSTIINPELLEDCQERGHRLFSELMFRRTNNPIDDIIESFAGRLGFYLTETQCIHPLVQDRRACRTINE